MTHLKKNTKRGEAQKTYYNKEKPEIFKSQAFLFMLLVSFQ